MAETVFTYGSPQLKFGDGASSEIGYDLAQLGVRRALLVTDAGVAATGEPARMAAEMKAFGVEAVVFDQVRRVGIDRIAHGRDLDRHEVARRRRSEAIGHSG
jgi:alcohol dehydrogenase class IV